MKATRHLLLLLGLSNLLHGQTTVTLDGATGSQSYALERSTNGGLTIGLGFQVEYLVVAGGGGGGGAYGGSDGGGGGGAGGMLAGATFLNAANISVTVGQGGGRGLNSSSLTDRRGKNGGDSSLGDLIAVGGGGGGATTDNSGGSANGFSGGSGGGAGAKEWGSGSGSYGGNPTSSQGHGGGQSVLTFSGWIYGAGGGGGAGGSGGNASESSQFLNESVRGGNGGAGLASSISGAAVIYAGGGGGGAERGNFGSETGGSGGSGGGGGGSTGNGNNGGNGTNNRGSGGGGAGNDANGGNGGSGIVILRYKGTEAGTGGTPGTGTAAGYTLHTFTSTGESALDLSNLDLSTRLGAVENGVISGSGDLTFTGPGTLTLKAANTYSGLTRINAGTLALGSGGSIGSSSGVSIANGSNFNVSTVTGGFTLGGEQTLSGGGTIAGDVTISGTHRPGFSPGIQVFADDLTYTVGSNVVWELIDDTVSGRGTEYDGVDVSGDLTFTGSTTITLDFALLGSMVDWTNEFWNNDYTGTNGWKVFDVGGEITGFENLTLEGSMMDKNGTSLTSERSGASFFLFEGADGVYLNYAVVPEPSAALLAGLGLLALLRRRR
jgi:hypothetical protein